MIVGTCPLENGLPIRSNDMDHLPEAMRSLGLPAPDKIKPPINDGMMIMD